MHIKCTKVLLDKLKINSKDVQNQSISSQDMNNWHANIIKFWRVNTILLTQDKTLYSFFLGGYKAEDFKNFEKNIREDIFKIIVNLDFQANIIETIIDSMENISYSKTDNKSVLGTMNQIKYFIESWVSDNKDIIDINKSINQIPLSALNRKYSSETFSQLYKSL